MPLLPSKRSFTGSDAHVQRRILLLDAYDSFTNNIVSLLKSALGRSVHIHVLHMDLKTLHADPTPDWTTEQFLQRLSSFDAVVCGPGPGSPLCEKDVGAFRLLWELCGEKAVPVMGICLGFQSLVAHFGGNIRKLRRGLHGMVRNIDHRGRGQIGGADIFGAVPDFKATLYHSLCADVGQDDVSDEDWDQKRWDAPVVAPELVPLGWVVEPEQGNERVLMAVRHKALPFWGVQYHPESVCTEKGARHVLVNWFQQALKWNEANGRQIQPWLFPSAQSDSLDSPQIGNTPREASRNAIPSHWQAKLTTGLAKSHESTTYICEKIEMPLKVDTAEVAELVCKGAKEAVVLDSSSAPNGDPLATCSVIALDVDAALRFEYHVGNSYAVFRQPATSSSEEVRQKIELGDTDPNAAWRLLSAFAQIRKIFDEDGAQPSFKGGFMGFVTYEMGLSTVSEGAVKSDRGHNRPDICMAWITKSIVLEHKTGIAYVQQLAAPGSESTWCKEMALLLQQSAAWTSPGSTPAPRTVKATMTNEELLEDVSTSGSRLGFMSPKPAGYEKDVSTCQDYIAEGESYELCLTAQTRMIRPKPQVYSSVPIFTRATDISAPPTAWDMYRTQRARQPAPFGSFIRLGGATIMSSSPERFLSNTPQGLCRMRPMKGTVRKSAAVSTLEQAEKILHIPKEEAENLMIVDLVRHDLHGVCGPERVTVPDLLKVEEYATLFTMVTAVHGQLPGGADIRSRTNLSGLDVLAAALPPGSMTGAPKKRSCEILTTIEPTERSIYSGVVGFFDVKGQGDWSVTIRTMFRWDDEEFADEANGTKEVFRIGAGGAVTILSTPEGETEEMFTKLCGPMGVFRDVA